MRKKSSGYGTLNFCKKSQCDVNFWTAVHCFDLPRIDRRSSTWFKLSRIKHMKIDLNGNENLASESYRGFKLPWITLP